MARRTTAPARTLRGPHAHYRPKDPRPITLNLTTAGRERLDAICEREVASRNDVVEELVVKHGDDVRFNK